MCPRQLTYLIKKGYLPLPLTGEPKAGRALARFLYYASFVPKGSRQRARSLRCARSVPKRGVTVVVGEGKRAWHTSRISKVGASGWFSELCKQIGHLAWVSYPYPPMGPLGGGWWGGFPPPKDFSKLAPPAPNP
jgi:hypothetical protein